MAKMRKRAIGEYFICGKSFLGADVQGTNDSMLPKALQIPGPGKDAKNVMACTEHPGILDLFLNYGAGMMMDRVKRALAKAEHGEV